MLESLDNVSGHPGRSNLDLAGIPRKLTFNLANLSGHPGRKMYPGRDRIAWSGYNPPVSIGEYWRLLGGPSGSSGETSM